MANAEEIKSVCKSLSNERLVREFYNWSRADACREVFGSGKIERYHTVDYLAAELLRRLNANIKCDFG